MPILGITMPNMGIKIGRALIPVITRGEGIAGALFSTTQQRLLALLFGQPDRSFFANELIALAGGGSGGVQRELARLAKSELVTVTRVGTQKHFQANARSPIFSELCSISQKTVGIVEPLREALAPLTERIIAAFVFGSLAKRQDRASSDIDVLILSNSVDYADAFAALQTAEAQLGRTINPTVYTPANWRRKRKAENGFVLKVSNQPKLFIIGKEEDLE